MQITTMMIMKITIRVTVTHETTILSEKKD